MNEQAGTTPKPMPVVFVGHGNPMNALNRRAVPEWRRSGACPATGILSVSRNGGSQDNVTAMESPSTIQTSWLPGD